MGVGEGPTKALLMPQTAGWLRVDGAVFKEARMDQTPDLTTEEMVEILKAIARDGGNAAARIAAIKELRAIRGEGKPVADAFAALDASARVRLKAV